MVWVDGHRYLKLYEKAVSYAGPIEALSLSSENPFSTLRVNTGDEPLSFNMTTSNLLTAANIGFYHITVELAFAADAATRDYFADLGGRQRSDTAPAPAEPGSTVLADRV